MCKYYVKDVINHRILVQQELNKIIQELQQRLIHHDKDKILNDIIFDNYAPNVEKLRNTVYDSKEYHEILELMEPGWIEHMENRHHWVEEKFNKERLTYLSLIDILEIVCDWIGSIKRHTNDKEKILEGVRHNIIRYELENWDTLIINTATELLK